MCTIKFSMLEPDSWFRKSSNATAHAMSADPVITYVSSGCATGAKKIPTRTDAIITMAERFLRGCISELDMKTLVWTRGELRPLDRRKITLAFEVPNQPNAQAAE